MLNYGSIVKYSICNGKINPQTTVLRQKKAFGSVTPPRKNYDSCMKNRFYNRIPRRRKQSRIMGNKRRG